MRGFRRDGPLGEMRIVSCDGSWHLYLDDEFVESYYAPVRALDDLRSHTTGHHGWDRRVDLEVPEDLREWELLG